MLSMLGMVMQTKAYNPTPLCNLHQVKQKHNLCHALKIINTTVTQADQQYTCKGIYIYIYRSREYKYKDVTHN